MFTRFIAFLAIAITCGCHSPGPVATTPKGSLAVCWSANTSHGTKAWLEDCERHFGKPVLLLMVHGGPDERGVWTIWPDPPRPRMTAEQAAWLLKDMAEGREVVLISCNRAGSTLHVPGVWYSQNIVSSVPRWPRWDWDTRIGDFKRSR